jgi:hypothetical protein
VPLQRAWQWVISRVWVVDLRCSEPLHHAHASPVASSTVSTLSSGLSIWLCIASAHMGVTRHRLQVFFLRISGFVYFSGVFWVFCSSALVGFWVSLVGFGFCWVLWVTVGGCNVVWVVGFGWCGCHLDFGYCGCFGCFGCGCLLGRFAVFGLVLRL